MTAREVLARVLEAGGRVIQDPQRPRLLVPALLRPLVEAHRAELRRLICAEEMPVEGRETHIARLLGMPLHEFAQEGQSLEVRVPWLDATLWMVPTDRDAAALLAEGIRRGRIWTAAELLQLMAIADRTPQVVKTLAHAKLELDGDVVEVRRR